jgi:hypothetical protein
MRIVYKTFVRTPEWERPLERPRRRWEDNIKMNLREMYWVVVKWIHLAQDRDHNKHSQLKSMHQALLNNVKWLDVPSTNDTGFITWFDSPFLRDKATVSIYSPLDQTHH